MYWKPKCVHAPLVRTTYPAPKTREFCFFLFFFFSKRQRLYDSAHPKEEIQENRMLLSWQDPFFAEPCPKHTYKVLFFSWHYVSLPAKLISAMQSPCCYRFIAKVNQSVLKRRREPEAQNPRCPQRETFQFCNPSKSVLSSTSPGYQFHALFASTTPSFLSSWHHLNSRCTILLSLSN